MDSPAEYLNFDLLITRSDDQYRVYVIDAPGGNADKLFDLPSSADKIVVLAQSKGTRRKAKLSGKADATAAPLDRSDLAHSRLAEKNRYSVGKTWKSTTISNSVA